ncbi:hypothetical protein [Bacillus haynesii]|uniref:hypothetical protein n=1 Tax=Bacillus haynesii TaxID=1925021 RepID=UPI0004AF6B21|nr:hypothetical protein [Bacillus haynesii]
MPQECIDILDGREKEVIVGLDPKAKKRALQICFKSVIRRRRKSRNTISQEAGGKTISAS